MTTYFTKIEITEAAAAITIKAGFVHETASGESEAQYLAFPGREGLLRIACHRKVHGYGVAHSLNLDPYIDTVVDEFGDEEFEIAEWKLTELVEEAIREYHEATK